MARPVSPAIVIAAHDRPHELERLLVSVLAADIAPDTSLIISIDGGGRHQKAVRSVADSVEWPHGPFTVVEHAHLGLVDHFLACGDLTEQHDAVVLLEDDLIVGPAFHRWASAALTHCHDDDRIAGVSLAAPFFDGYRHLPFEPVLDGSDGLFAQVPWYDGMAWTTRMWRDFRTHQVDPATPIHRAFASLAADEWFPDAVRYLVATNRHYLLPRNAHVTNSGAAGTHFSTNTNYFQVPLTLRTNTDWRLATFDESLAIYDDHLELAPHVVQQLVPELAQMDLTIDLLATRDLTQCTTDFVLTTRQATTTERSWGASLHPLVANLVHSIDGADITLAARSAVISSEASDAHAATVLDTHASRGRSPSDRDALRQLGGSLKRRFNRDR